MSNPLEIELTLQRELPPFQRNLARGLRLNAADQREITAIDWTLWTPWMMATFGAGEAAQALRASDPSVKTDTLTKRAQELLGAEITHKGETYLELMYGELSERAQALVVKKDPGSRGRFDVLTSACAQFLVASCVLMGPLSPEWRAQVPSVPQTVIDANRQTGQGLRIRFPANDFEYPLSTPPESVVTFGPGMSGSAFTSNLSGRAKNVHFVSGGIGALFVSKWIGSQLQRAAAGMEDMRASGNLAAWIPGVPVDQIRLPETFFYNDGIAASIGMIASRTVERGNPIDVVVMSSVHSAGRQEVEAGVDGAYQLLKEGGLLVVKAPRTSIADEGGLDVAAARAMPLFGSPAAAGECGWLAQYIDSALPIKRPADFAIYQKQ